MTDSTIRRLRITDEPVVRMKASVRASTGEALQNAAHESGISIGLYLERILERIRDEEGGTLPLFNPTETTTRTRSQTNTKAPKIA